MDNNIGKDFGLIERNEVKGKNYTIRETITVKIAPSHTVYTDINNQSTKSKFGHAWIEFKGESIGWGMGESKELFGNNTFNILGDYTKHGFDALSQYDNNQDNRIDNNDVIWSSLNLWIDKNINGKTDIDELVNIECSGIESIDLNYKKNGVIDESGNQFLLTSSVTWSNGYHTEISDIVFNTHITSQQNNILPNNGDLWL